MTVSSLMCFYVIESEKTEKDSPSTGLSTFLQEISQKKLPVEKSNDQDATGESGQ